MNKKNGPVSGDMMQKQQFDTKTLRRLLSYMKDYKGQLIFVVICILLSAIASAASALFLQSLIDDYIAPLLTSSAPVFTQLLKVLVVIGAVYLIGVLATLFYKGNVYRIVGCKCNKRSTWREYGSFIASDLYN